MTLSYPVTLIIYLIGLIFTKLIWKLYFCDKWPKQTVHTTHSLMQSPVYVIWCQVIEKHGFPTSLCFCLILSQACFITNIAGHEILWLPEMKLWIYDCIIIIFIICSHNEWEWWLLWGQRTRSADPTPNGRRKSAVSCWALEYWFIDPTTSRFKFVQIRISGWINTSVVVGSPYFVRLSFCDKQTNDDWWIIIDMRTTGYTVYLTDWYVIGRAKWLISYFHSSKIEC